MHFSESRDTERRAQDNGGVGVAGHRQHAIIQVHADLPPAYPGPPQVDNPPTYDQVVASSLHSIT